MAAGLVDEVRSVEAFRRHTRSRPSVTLEIFDHFDGKITLPEAIDGIKIHTRQYAKRQLIWFRRDAAMQWFDAREGDAIETAVMQQLKA